MIWPPEPRLVYVKKCIDELKNYIECNAIMKRVEFSIFFKSGSSEHVYPFPNNSFILPFNVKKDIVDFLDHEGFYYIEWYEHVVINLVKLPIC